LAAGDTPLNSLGGNRTLPRPVPAGSETTPRLRISRELGVSLWVGLVQSAKREQQQQRRTPLHAPRRYALIQSVWFID
jgi:hypothetical protein